MWTTFQSASTDKEIALGFSLDPQVEDGIFETSKELLLFEVYLNGENSCSTQIELKGDEMSFYPTENEVLLLPMFTF